jgi:hypothetical protein
MKIKKWYIITLAVAIILVFTNPSEKSFQNYLTDNERKFIYTKRTGNFLLFSIYRKDANEINDQTYIGVLNHFILIKKKVNFL